MIGRNGAVPFTVDTDLDLGRAAAPWIRAHGADVTIRRGAVPYELPDSEAEGPTWQRAGNRVLIAFPWSMRFLVEGGERIRYAAPDDCGPLDLRLFLLGTAWPALALQRGLLPLHTSAVARGKDIYAFTAPTGNGKSTLGAALSTRGYPFFADDSLLIDADDVTQCYGYKDLKLWSVGAALAGLRPGGRVRETTGYDKRYVEPPRESPHTSGRLKVLCVLSRDMRRGGVFPSPSLEPLAGREALLALYMSVHRKRMARAILGGRAPIFERIRALARTTDVYRFRRPFVGSLFDEGVSIIAGKWPPPESP